jgi:hypothetical protein
VLIAGGFGAAGRAVIAADREPPALIGAMILSQKGGREGEIAIGIEQFAGVTDTRTVIAHVDLAESHVRTRTRLTA